MQLTLDLADRHVVIVGAVRAARRSIARYLSAGAVVYVVADDAAQAPAVHRVDPPASANAWRDLLGTMDLVVVVDAAPSVETTIVEVCAELRVWLTREPAAATSPVGHVTLVGGGPGDDELLTVAAMSALRAADIVYFDRLGPSDRLSEWAPGATLVNVGKTPGHHAVPQHEIERMLVQSARDGDTVVRLKGGDPFVFGRGGEEVIACRDARVPVTVISGVSSAIAAPAAAGIPVTHREISRLFTVISGHAPLSEVELAHLVGLGGTIVVLMGVGTLPHLSAGLARHGMRADMPLAIIERAFSSSQRTTVTSISTAVNVATQAGVRSPAVIVIGEVVRLSHDEDVAAVELLHTAARLAG
ncbi:MAG TPA: uroporphyrinogen-III C-methyltransferase [Microbacteriaceae bacterium]|jgi:uroporphyrin-III C-methyltransferase|nr:uroporphyrinogen-III C-methyltransferase [Microbacteriaceae bacterium]